MKKRFLSVALCAAMIGSLTACGLKSPEEPATQAPAATEATEAAKEEQGDTAEEEATEKAADSADVPDASGDPQVTLVYAEVNPLDTIVGKVATKFKESVEEMSGGSIQIDIQASGVLGAEGDVLDNMVGGVGTIDMARISVATMTSYGTPKAALLAAPYEFVSREHFWNFAKSDVAKEMLTESEEVGLGLKGLFYGEEGFRHIFTTTPVNSLEDLQGKKIRVSTDPVMVNTINAMGANATVIAYTELYSSLQTGVVDGAENPINNYKANAFNEVAPNLILNGHQLGVVEVVITDTAWNKLTDAQKECMTQAAAICAEYNEQIVQEGEDSTLELLKQEGTNIVEVADKTPWVEACKDVIDEVCKGYEDLHAKIQALQ